MSVVGRTGSFCRVDLERLPGGMPCVFRSSRIDVFAGRSSSISASSAALLSVTGSRSSLLEGTLHPPWLGPVEFRVDYEAGRRMLTSQDATCRLLTATLQTEICLVGARPAAPAAPLRKRRNSFLVEWPTTFWRFTTVLCSRAAGCCRETTSMRRCARRLHTGVMIAD